jgi:hypothetical protein
MTTQSSSSQSIKNTLVNKFLHYSCALLGYYAERSGNALPTFPNNLSVPSSRVKKSGQEVLDFLALEDGTDTLSRNVGKALSLDAA